MSGPPAVVTRPWPCPRNIALRLGRWPRTPHPRRSRRHSEDILIRVSFEANLGNIIAIEPLAPQPERDHYIYTFIDQKAGFLPVSPSSGEF
jgi:hypothetical protein